MDFKRKVVLITGASSGIGAETAVYFAALGACLSLTGRNREKLEETADECQRAAAGAIPEPLCTPADVNDAEDLERIVLGTIERFGRLDVLVNNAGIAAVTTLESMDMDDFESVFSTNVRAVVRLTKLALPHLLASRGNVVNVSSAAGLRPSRGLLAYCMSKSALDQFTRCLALELGDRGVRVNAVNPGVVLTNIQSRSGIASADRLQQFAESTARVHPIGRIGECKEIAAAIAFLASDAASNITGVLLPVDGGHTIEPPMNCIEPPLP